MKNSKGVVTPLDSFEKYAALKSSLNSLRERHSDNQKRMQEARNTKHAESHRDTETAERIARLTGEEPSGVGEHLSRLPVLTAEASDLSAAISVLESKIACERVAVSKQICERVEPEYRKRVAAICSALIELNARMADYASMVGDLQSNDIAWAGYLRPMGVQFVDRANDRAGPVASYLREAVAYKMIDRSLVPPELK